MFIQIFPSGPFSTNAYVVACEHTHEAAVIDPAPGSFSSIRTFLESQGLTCRKILLTHSHWDHIADVQRFKEQYDAPVYIHPLDAPNLQKPGADGLPCWLNIPGIEPDVRLEEGMQVLVGDLTFQVIHTPGHSPGGICFYEPQQHVLFSGDTLFKGTIGNLSFPNCQPDLMWPSLEKLSRLPLQTRIFPGHGPETNLAAESSWLPQARQLFS